MGDTRTMDNASGESRPTVFGVYQGWVVVIAVMLSLAVASGGRFLFGVVLKPVADEYGWGRAELAFAVTINVVMLSILQPIVGLLVDRFGSRRVLIFGACATGLAMIPMAMAHALWQIYVIYGVVAALGFAATSPVNTTALVNGWFEQKRGLALSLATSGSAYGQLLVVPIATVIVLRWGWRAAYWSVAGALFVVVLPLVVWFVRDSPARRAVIRAHAEERAAGASAGADERVTVRQALRTASYWQLSFGMFVCGFTMSFTSVHLIAYLTDMPMQPGMSMRAIASLALSVVGGFSIIGSIVLGVLADRKGRREILALTYFLRGLSFLVLLLVGSWVPGIFIAAVVLGISWTSTTPLGAAIAADIYGRASIGAIFGFIYTAMNLGSALGAWLAGLDRDNLGNYRASLVANVVLGLAAAAITLTMRVKPFVADAPQTERRAVPATGVAGD